MSTTHQQQVLMQTENSLQFKNIQSLDRAACSEAFISINPYLFKMLLAKHIYGEEAEDLVCETWETYLKNHRAFEGRSQLKTFLGGILINKIRESRRYHQRLINTQDEEIHRDSVLEGWWNKSPDLPELQLIHQQTHQHILKCIECLSAKQKTVFILREILEDDTSSICKKLNISSTFMNVLLYRAKKELQKCLELT